MLKWFYYSLFWWKRWNCANIHVLQRCCVNLLPSVLLCLRHTLSFFPPENTSTVVHRSSLTCGLCFYVKTSFSPSRKTVSCLSENPSRISSCLWEPSIEFQGKPIQSNKCMWEVDKGKQDWKRNEGKSQLGFSDVWRFVCVAESIRPWVFLVILLFPSTCPGALTRHYNSRRLRRKSTTTVQNPSDLSFSFPPPSSITPFPLAASLLHYSHSAHQSPSKPDRIPSLILISPPSCFLPQLYPTLPFSHPLRFYPHST